MTKSLNVTNSGFDDFETMAIVTASDLLLFVLDIPESFDVVWKSDNNDTNANKNFSAQGEQYE